MSLETELPTEDLRDLEGAEFHPMITSSGELMSPEIVNLSTMTLVGRVATMKRTGELDSQPHDPTVVQEIIEYAHEASDPAYWLTGV